MKALLTPDEVVEQTAARLKLSVARKRVFGVDYYHVVLPGQGDLYVTAYGRGWLEHLLPENWDDRTYYAQPEHQGLRVELKGTGRPHRVTTKPVGGRTLDLVVKRCRVGQDTQVYKSRSASFISDEEVMNARWNGPFEEFGLLYELRATNTIFRRKVRTQLPLAIYTPEDRVPLWKTGRQRHHMFLPNMLMRKDQDRLPPGDAIELDIQRRYIMLYQWVKGMAATEVQWAFGAEGALEAFTRRVYEEDLLERGFTVTDTKPEHIIVRPEGRGLRRGRDGELVYALVDFELLQRSQDHEQKYHIVRRRKYWSLHAQARSADKPVPPSLHRYRLFGVDYIYGKASNQGRLWVVGLDPDLFDYYDPMRWRHTPRIQLSGITYRTVSLDDIQLVYRRSRVGIKPQEYPFSPTGSNIVHFGYNSPFEEMAIATQLRALGFRTAYPRAIYRTAHESLPAEYLFDPSRYEAHAGLETPDGEPLLSERHDYYTIWGLWRGVDPLMGYAATGHWGLIDAARARDLNVLSASDYEALVARTNARLARIGLIEPFRTDRLLLHFDRGALARDVQGEYDVTICIDGYRAYQRGILPEQEYASLIATKLERLARFGYEALDFRGDHLLLSMDPDGHFDRDETGRILCVLCNFELIKPPPGVLTHGQAARTAAGPIGLAAKQEAGCDSGRIPRSD